MEYRVQLMNERLIVFMCFLSSPGQYFPLDQKDKFIEQRQNILKNQHNFILKSSWIQNIPTMVNLTVIY